MLQENELHEIFSKNFLEQAKIWQIKKAKPQLKKKMLKLVEDFEKMRGAPFFYKTFSSGKGHGPFIELLDGSVKYNLIASMGINILGHSHPLYIRSCLEACQYDVITSSNLLPTLPTKEFTQDLLKAVSKTNLKHFWFACSGSMANDQALKIAWQKQFPKKKIIAFDRAFSGRSIAQQEITFEKSYREKMPENLEVYHVPHFDILSPNKAKDKTIKALNKLYKEHDDEFAVLVIELIQGEAGFIWGDKEYYKAIFQWAKKRNILIWIDEIQTFARTTALFSFEYFGLQKYPDIVTIGKAFQVCGTLFSDRVKPLPGLIGGTYSASITSVIAAKNILNFLQKAPFFGKNGKNKSIELEFLSGLKKIKVKNPRAIGALVSFEVGDSSKAKTIEFLKRLFENGAIAYMAGHNPYRVRFLLPLTITKEHISEILTLIKKSL